jgi:hypothetical protein
MRLYKIRFRKWLELEELKDKIIRAVGENSVEFPKHTIQFLSTALPFSFLFNSLPWIYPLKAFVFVTKLSYIETELPLMRSTGSKNNKKDAWDYEGRNWHFYSHMLAKAYGWSLEYIARLGIEEALAKIQEILTNEQLEKEFQWMMTEVAYKYDKGSKKSYLQKLDRPHFMRPTANAPKKTKISKSYIPVGNVDYSALGEDMRPKEIEKTT